MNKQLKTLAFVSALGLADLAGAASLEVNFDSLDAKANTVKSETPLTGPTLDSYLAGYGITVTSFHPTMSVGVFNIADEPGITTPSQPNVFSTAGDFGPYGYDTFTLNFSSPVSNFSFSRVGIVAREPGTWSATAYNAANQSLAVVAEDLLDTGIDSSAARTFALNVQGISHVVFWGTNHPLEHGSGTPIIDNLTFQTPVPEPETCAMLLLGLGLVGVVARRRKITATR